MNEADSTVEEDANEQETPQSPPSQGGGFEALKNHMLQHKIESALWVTRALTLLFGFLYIIPIFSNPYNCYQKVLISNAATSALRLHQRIPNVQFTREFLAQLFLEDSAHYLFYSIIFMYTSPIMMVLVPIFLFALLHFASYSLALLDILGAQQWLVSRFFISLVEYLHRDILRCAAFVEIFLMPLSILSLFWGQVNILTPFLYYRFLTLRYTSRRNPYTRTMFYELRTATEELINKPFFPSFLRVAVMKMIGFVSRMAPVH